MMKMNRKGFTLIELLAIIVILAIIAVITVPIILNIIDNARKGAAKSSVTGYGKAVELAYTQYQYDVNLGSATNVTTATTDGKAIDVVLGATTGTTTRLAVDFDGDKVVCSTAYIVEGKLTLEGCEVSGRSEDYKYVGGIGKLATED